MVCAFAKQYLIAQQPADCLEIFDWHSLPGLKGSGVGLRVMRAMMRDGRRLIGIGGTTDVLKALPALGWQTLGSAVYYELPLAGSHLRASAEQRLGRRLPGTSWLFATIGAVWFRPRRRRASLGIVTVSASTPEGLDALYTDCRSYDLLQVPNRGVLEWSTNGYPGAGQFTFLRFTKGSGSCGWALTRVYETENGREAAIVDIFAPSADLETYQWMTREAALSLLAAHPRVIRARASHPALQAALTANGFRPGDSVPIFTWPKLPSGVTTPHITLNHCDAWLRPYPKPETMATG
jgi:hypothetical protein